MSCSSRRSASALRDHVVERRPVLLLQTLERARADPRPPAAAPATRRCSPRRPQEEREVLELRLHRVPRVEVGRESRVERGELAELLPHRRRAPAAPPGRLRRARRRRRRRDAGAGRRWRAPAASAASSSSSPGFGDAASISASWKVRNSARDAFCCSPAARRCALVAELLPGARTPSPTASRSRRQRRRSRRADRDARPDRAAPGARAVRADRRARPTASRSAALVASAPSTKARLRPCAETSRRTITRAPSGVSKMASTAARLLAGADEVGEARPPTSRPTAPTRMDLPAPVSPVSTFKPGSNSSSRRSMTARWRELRKRIIAAASDGRKYHLIRCLTVNGRVLLFAQPALSQRRTISTLRRHVCARLDTAPSRCQAQGAAGSWARRAIPTSSISSRTPAGSRRSFSLILLLFSAVSWGIILYKIWQFRRAGATAATFLEVFRKSSKFSEVQAICRDSGEPARRHLPSRDTPS